MERNDPNSRVIYTVKEVSLLLHSNIGYVYQLIDLGLLPALKLGSLKVRKEALDEFLRKYEGFDLSDLNDIKSLQSAS
ncbi:MULTISPECIES: helix-turn-helix domain-containing protein [Oscillibacter]|uniref:helix-turn-helix domain-containing protein n=1 Tax=Oscillibacter sp. TaxID=1945593 RepID=UPI00289EBF54|nr:helix-turn-helix domain-containing protein [Oscillibacter sp.]